MFKFIFACLFFQVQGFILELPADLAPDALVFKQARVVGGIDAPEGRVPYQASLKSWYNSHFCGGSILNNRWILTAAHCTAGQSKYGMSVTVGTTNRISGGKKYSVERIIIHKNFDSEAISNDISLIKVDRDIEFNELVQPIQLPDADTGDGVELMLSGWGRISYPGNLPVQLQMINLTSVSVAKCQSIYSKINPVYPTQICSLTKYGEGACHGDSGGPLVAGNALVGIVSWGMPCAKGYPDVYTRVYSFKDWILKSIADDAVPQTIVYVKN